MINEIIEAELTDESVGDSEVIGIALGDVEIIEGIVIGDG